MRFPLHARASAIAATICLALLLIVNIVTGQHAGPPLGATPANADYIYSDSSSEDSLLSEAFSSILNDSSSSDPYFIGSSSSTYSTVTYTGAASSAVYDWDPSPCDNLCAAASSNAAALAIADFNDYCTSNGMTPGSPYVNFGECSCTPVQSYGGLVETYTAVVSASATGICQPASSSSSSSSNSSFTSWSNSSDSIVSSWSSSFSSSSDNSSFFSFSSDYSDSLPSSVFSSSSSSDDSSFDPSSYYSSSWIGH